MNIQHLAEMAAQKVNRDVAAKAEFLSKMVADLLYEKHKMQARVQALADENQKAAQVMTEATEKLIKLSRENEQLRAEMERRGSS